MHSSECCMVWSCVGSSADWSSCKCLFLFCAAVENAMALLKSAWRLAALLVSVAQSM